MSGLSSRFIMYKEMEGEDTTNRPTIYEGRKYHDLIEEMLSDEDFVRERLPDAVVQAMIVARDTLCWTLGHDSNESFPINLNKWANDFTDFRGLEDIYDN